MDRVNHYNIADRIMELLQDHREHTCDELAVMLHTSRHAVLREVAQLVAKGAAVKGNRGKYRRVR
jgi:biotin operon repressor